MRRLIASGAEGFVADTGQHDARDLPIVGREMEGLYQLLERLPPESVVDFRPVDDDPRRAMVNFVDDVGELLWIGHSVSSRLDHVHSARDGNVLSGNQFSFAGGGHANNHPSVDSCDYAP